MATMRMLRPAGYPANRAAGRWVFDVLVTVAAAAVAVPNLLNKASHPGPAAFIVLAVIVAPLVVRRVWPIPVFGWILATGFAAFWWNKHLVAAPALLIALYTVAALRSRRAALVCAGLVEVVVVVGLVLFAGHAWWPEAIQATGGVAAALGLGLYSATRRAYLAELRDRADRLERERDQQGALAAAAERARIAREMHDVVAHHLTVMVTLSGHARRVGDRAAGAGRYPPAPRRAAPAPRR